jgi:hypothetical protein
MDQTFDEYQFPKDAYQGYHQLKFNKNLTLKYAFIKDGYSSFENEPYRYHFLGSKVSKLDLINLIIKLWPYRSEIENFDFKIMPWLEVLVQDNYRFVWTNKCLKAQNVLLREYCTKWNIKLMYPLK